MPSILISGKPGAGSTTLAKLLASKLQLDYFSPGQLFKDVALGKVKNQFYYPLFKKMCDAKKLKVPDMNSSDNSNATIDLWKTQFGSSTILHNIIDKLQKVLAKKGDIVIDGKLSLFIIKSADLKVWLNADTKARAARTSFRDNLSKDTAIEIIKEREKNERATWKKIYGLDYFSQETLADLVIDTSKLSPEQVLERILAKL